MTVQAIHLHGFMGKKYGKSVRLSGSNLFQIMSGLVSRFGPGFKEDVRTGKWHLIEGTMKGGSDIGENELRKTLTKKSLHLIPAVEGASSAVRIVIGVVLIAVDMLYLHTGYLTNLGAAMVLGGVVEMLTKPKLGGPSQNEGDKGSSIYNGALNVTTQGGPVPLIYGRVQRASSIVISTDFSSDDA